MKSMLVIETPTECVKCPLCNDGQCDALGKYLDDVFTRYERCPLRQLPEVNTWDVTENGHVTEFAEGWNACLEEIMGETE